MGTSYEQIFDLALVSIEDYKLNQLYTTSPEDFLEVMKGFMLRAVPNFDNCVKNLSDRDDDSNLFNISLSDVEKDIIADWMVIVWLDKEINDAKQITGMLQNKNEAHRYSEAQNLTSKTARRTQLHEGVRNKMTRYGLRNFRWDD